MDFYNGKILQAKDKFEVKYGNISVWVMKHKGRMAKFSKFLACVMKSIVKPLTEVRNMAESRDENLIWIHC